MVYFPSFWIDVEKVQMNRFCFDHVLNKIESAFILMFFTLLIDDIISIHFHL